MILFVKVSFAQNNLVDTIWFDSDWKEISKKHASFFRTVKKSGTIFLVSDYYLNGNLQMIAEASQLNPLVKSGTCTYYNKNQTKSSIGSYKNGKQFGAWVYYYDNQKDSSLLTVSENGDKNYTRRSKFEDIYTVVEYMPEYPGGVNEMIKFIQNNIRYPKNAQDKSLGGKAFLKFVVDSTGKISEVNITKSTGVEELDQEALRVVRAMPNWKPGSQNGKNVNVFFNLPLNFSLRDPYFIFNVNNSDINYNSAKELVINGKLDEALDIYQKINGDIEVWYNLGVIYHLKKDYRESKSYFNKIIANVTDQKNTYLVQSKYFAAK